MEISIKGLCTCCTTQSSVEMYISKQSSRTIIKIDGCTNHAEIEISKEELENLKKVL